MVHLKVKFGPAIKCFGHRLQFTHTSECREGEGALGVTWWKRISGAFGFRVLVPQAVADPPIPA